MIKIECEGHELLALIGSRSSQKDQYLSNRSELQELIKAAMANNLIGCIKSIRALMCAPDGGPLSLVEARELVRAVWPA